MKKRRAVHVYAYSPANQIPGVIRNWTKPAAGRGPVEPQPPQEKIRAPPCATKSTITTRRSAMEEIWCDPAFRHSGTKQKPASEEQEQELSYQPVHPGNLSRLNFEARSSAILPSSPSSSRPDRRCRTKKHPAAQRCRQKSGRSSSSLRVIRSRFTHPPILRIGRSMAA